MQKKKNVQYILQSTKESNEIKIMTCWVHPNLYIDQ